MKTRHRELWWICDLYELDCVYDQHSHGKSVGKYLMINKINMVCKILLKKYHNQSNPKLISSYTIFEIKENISFKAKWVTYQFFKRINWKCDNIHINVNFEQTVYNTYSYEKRSELSVWVKKLDSI